MRNVITVEIFLVEQRNTSFLPVVVNGKSIQAAIEKQEAAVIVGKGGYSSHVADAIWKSVLDPNVAEPTAVQLICMRSAFTQSLIGNVPAVERMLIDVEFRRKLKLLKSM